MSLPYFPYYPKDFQAKAAHLTFAEEGAYIRLLRLSWFTPGCTLPNDHAWIFRKIIARSEEDQEATRIVLSEFFQIEDGRIFNPKLCLIYKTQNEAHQKKVEAGRLGGKVKSLKNNKKGSSKSKAKLKQPEPEPEPLIKDPKGSKKKKVRTSWPSEDWRPDPLSQKMKDKLRMSQEEYRDEFDKFRENCKAHNRQYVDWNAAWRTWIQSDYSTYGRRKAGKGAPTSGNSGGSRNGRHSAGLGGPIERRLEERERQAEADAGYLDLGGGSGPIIDDVPFSTNADPKRLG